MVTDLPKHLLRLLVALVRHRAKTWLGEEALGVVGGTLAEIGGEELQARLDRWLKEEATARQLLEVARRADGEFRDRCDDPALLQALTLDFGTLPSVQAVLADLPQAMDLTGVERALREALARDLGRRLTPAQIDAGARLYAEALQMALLPFKDYALPIIGQIVLQIRQEQRAGFAATQAKLEEVLARLGEDALPSDLRPLREALVRGQVLVLGDLQNSVVIVGAGNAVTVAGERLAALREQITLPGDLPPGSYLPSPRNALFTGREKDLRRLTEVVCGPHSGGGGHAAGGVITQAIAGMGGVGKTQLVVEFAYRHGYRFRGVHWLDMSDPALLGERIAARGEEMGLRQAEGETRDDYADRVLKVWKADGPRLLLLDNLEDLEAARKNLHRLRHSNLRLLLTARRRDWPDYLGLEVLPLDEFTPEESRAFLRRYLPAERAADADLDRLADRLGHLPLALDLADRYLKRQKHITVAEYLARLEDLFAHRSMQGWREDLGSPTEHDLSLRATFALSWDRVQGEDGRRLFCICSLLAPNTPIPEPILRLVVDDPEELGDAVSELVDLGLLKEGPAIHPLLAEFGRDLTPTPRPSPSSPTGEGVGVRSFLPALAALAEETNDRIDKTGDYTQFVPLLPHVRAAAGHTEPIDPPAAGRLWNNLGYHLRDIADYAGAWAALERALGIKEAIYEPDHPSIATTVNNLGLVLQDLGDLTGARAAFERALGIFWNPSADV